MAGRNDRADKVGPHKTQFRKNKAIIYARDDMCAICGKPVDKGLPYPHPMSKSIDHIIPLDRGGHPSDIDNLQLVHLGCNRAKGNKLPGKKIVIVEERPTNRNLPQSRDWGNFKTARDE